MVDVQEFTLKLMKEVDCICRKYGIEYYLAGGSVIGALRHKGFIPWDDDMDVYMTRDNWEKFKEAFEREKPENRILEASDIDPNYPNMIAKYTSTDTCAIYKNLLLGQHSAGIILDIFILDPMPDDEKACDKYLNDILLYSEFVNPFYVYTHRLDVKSKYRFYHFLEKLIGHEKVVKMLEKRLGRYSEAEASKYYLRWGGIPHLFDKSLFGKPRYVQFEDMMLPVPEKSYLYLCQLYGEDWIQIPSHDEEITHVCVFDAETSYTEFFKEYLPRIDTDSYLQKVIGRKMNRLKVGASYRDIQKNSLELHASRIAMNLESLDAKHDFQDLYQKKEFGLLNECFEEYFSGQCNSKFLGNKFFAGFYRFYHPIFVDIRDEILWIAVELLMRKGESYFAKRILSARRINKGNLSPELENQNANIERQIRATDYFERGCFDQAVALLDEGLKEKPDWINFLKLKIRILLRNKDQNVADIKELIETGRSVQGEDGEFIKYEADLIRSDDQEEALRLYFYAKQHTRNGYILTEIEEIFETYARELSENIEILLGDGKTEEAASLVKNMAEYFESLQHYDDYFTVLKETDYSNLKMQLANAKDKMLQKKDRNYGMVLKAILQKTGLSEKIAERINAVWESMMNEKSLEDSFYESLYKSEIPEEWKALGDYEFWKGNYPKAFSLYRRAARSCNKDSFLYMELQEIYQKDLLYFSNELSKYRNDARIRLCAQEWLRRHGSMEEWLIEVQNLCLIQDAVTLDYHQSDLQLSDEPEDAEQKRMVPLAKVLTEKNQMLVAFCSLIKVIQNATAD